MWNQSPERHRERSPELRIALYGNLAPRLSDEVLAALSRRGVSCRVVDQREVADISILCAWPDMTGDRSQLHTVATQIRRSTATRVIVLEAPDPLNDGITGEALDAWNRELAALTSDLNAHFIPIRAKFLRWGPRECLAGDFRPSMRGMKSIANAIAKLVVAERASTDISDEYVTLTCPRTGKSLSNLVRIDPGAADELLMSMCSPWAEIRPDQLSRDDSRLSALPVPTDAELTQARKLNQGIVAFGESYNWPDVHVGAGHDIDWSTSGPDRSWCSMFLGLDFLNFPLKTAWRLLEGKCTLGDAATEEGLVILNGALGVLGSFQVNNPPHASINPRAWHEGTATRRLRTLLLLLSCCIKAQPDSGSIQPGDFTRVGLEISRTASLLTSDATYKENGNHGVRQDATLYTVSRYLDGSREGDTWRTISLERMRNRQFKKALSQDGVWLEHSTGYHALVLSYLVRAEAVASRALDDEGLVLLRNWITRMQPFFAAALLADDSLVMIGDTEPDAHTALANRLEARPVGTHGGVAMFPDAGYMFCKYETSDEDTCLYLAFWANLKSPKHKQADDLSITLNEGSVPWLIDGGSINRETSDPRRNAARFDPGGHNTWRVNGEGYSFNQRGARHVAFLATFSQPDWCGASAVNRLYKGGEVTRFVAHIPQQRLVVVTDHLLAKEDCPAKFEQFWHLAPNSCVTQRPGGFVAVQQGHPTHLSIVVDSTVEDTWDQWEGGEEQPIGWIMTSWNQVVPNTVLRRTFTAHSRWSVTAFSLGRPGNAFHVREIRSSKTRATTTLVEGDSQISITVNLTGAISLESKHAP